MNITHPVHGSIEFNDMLTALINTPEVNRLKRITQLGLVSLVFPGGTHSRFLHAIGVCHLADKIADHLGIDEKEKMTVQAAALLHDIGHGPFSHTLDSLRKKDHEDTAKDIVLGKHRMSIMGAGKIPLILKKYRIDRQLVADLITGRCRKKPYLQQIINGPIDADKLDYLLTDSHFTGAKIGIIDIDRMISVMVLEDNQLKFLDKGKPAIKAIRTARSNMTAEVYIHHTARIADRMLLHAVQLSGLKDFHEYDDFTLAAKLMSSPHQKVKDIISRILYNYNPSNPKNNYTTRNLYKSAFQIPTTSFSSRRRALLDRLMKIGTRKIESALLRRTGLEKGDMIIDFPNTFPLYSDEEFDKLGIPFKPKQGKTNYSCFSVYCAKEHKEKTAKAALDFVRQASKRHFSSRWADKF